MDYKNKEWEEIFKILKSLKEIYTKNEEQIHQYMEAVWYVCRTGCQWRLLPSYMAIGDQFTTLKSGAIKESGKHCSSTFSINLTWKLL